MNYIDTIKHVNTESKFTLLNNGNLNVEHAAIIYKNCSGNPTKVNPAGGKRTFSLVLNREYAERLFDQGWNVKTLLDKETGEVNGYFTQIVLNYGFENNPPKVYRVLNGKAMLLSEDEVGSLDFDPISSADLIIYPHPSVDESTGATRYKGYVKRMYVNIETDPFADKYDFV